MDSAEHRKRDFIINLCDYANKRQEELVAERAIQQHRMDRLSSEIDALARRVEDCEQLTTEGSYDYEQAFNTMIKPQVERVVKAKNSVINNQQGQPT
jgi:hypothetical protein